MCSADSVWSASETVSNDEQIKAFDHSLIG